MSELGPKPITLPLRADSRWELARRVADSSYFRKGPKLRAFFLYVCENTILGRLEEVREPLIGCRVFGRPPDYNLSTDNIVRVEARELRKRLEAYFAEEGREEPVVIEIPKGAYVPVFKPREQAGPVPVETADEGAETAEAKEAEGRGQLPEAARARSFRWPAVALAIGFLLSTAALIWQWGRGPEGPGPDPGAADFAFYRDLLGTMGTTPQRETLLVLSNPPIIPYEFPQNPPRTEVLNVRTPLPKSPDYTGMGEAVTAYHAGRMFQSLNRPVRLTQGRFLNWDGAQKQDLIMLGGSTVNDWASQDVRRSNFNMVPGGKIENVKPLPGEPAVVVSELVSPHTGENDYGIIKMMTLPNNGKVLLLEGITSPGTAGVGEFFAQPAKMRTVWERIKAASQGKPFPSEWEVLLKITVRDALPVRCSILGLRPAPARRG